MLKIYKRALFVLIISALPAIIIGQNSTNSPFSMFGVGNLTDGGFGRNKAMGGASTALLSTSNLNPSNPASYIGLMPNSFIFEFGVNLNSYELKTPSESHRKTDGNINYLAIGFPIAKWWKSGIGLRPMSNIGYNIKETEVLPLDSVERSYQGNGGINNFYFDNTFKIFKPLSVGVKVGYTFGSLERSRDVSSFDTDTKSLHSTTTESKKGVFDAVSLGFGLHFHQMITEDFFLNIGAVYNLKTELTGDERKTLVTDPPNTGAVVVTNELSNQGILELPESYSIGASILLKQKLELAVDYQVDEWSKSSFFGEKQNYNDNERISAGIEYTPDYSSTKYLRLIKYRAGFNMTNSYLQFEDKQMQQVGGSLGFGFPLKNGTLINVAFQYYNREIPGENILKENFFQLHLNLSLKSSWFIKRKFY